MVRINVRAFALLLAAIAVLNVVFHDGIVQHERCAEHGELVDVTRDADVPHVDHADLAHAGLHTTDTHAGDADEHCPLATHPPRFESTHTAVAAQLTAVTIAVARAVAYDFVRASTDTWRTTPITGPPAQTA